MTVCMCNVSRCDVMSTVDISHSRVMYCFSSVYLIETHPHTHTHTTSTGIPDDETFPVRLRKSNTIVFSGPCLLEVLKDFENNKFHIALFTKEEAPRLIVKWQIDHVRQYGSHQSAFKFESGRQV